MSEKTCQYCDKVFQSEEPSAKFCSRNCCSVFHQKAEAKKLGPQICKGCNKVFLPKWPKKYKFCSPECSVANKDKYSREELQLPCVICGKLFPSFQRTAKTCSLECRNKWMSKKVMMLRAARDPSVKIGVGSGGNQHYDSSKSARWTKTKTHQYRQQAFDAHGMRCASCGLDNEILMCVHHKDMDRTNNEVSNLAVFCHNCHYLVHSAIRAAVRAGSTLSAELCVKLCENQIAESKSRKIAGNSQVTETIRPEGTRQPVPGATTTGTSAKVDMNRHEAAIASILEGLDLSSF